MWPFKTKIVEKTVQVEKVVIGEPSKVSLFRAKVFDELAYKIADSYTKVYGKDYFYNYHYYLSCKDAFLAHPGSAVDMVEAYKVQDSYFIGRLSSVSINKS